MLTNADIAMAMQDEVDPAETMRVLKALRKFVYETTKGAGIPIRITALVTWRRGEDGELRASRT